MIHISRLGHLCFLTLFVVAFGACRDEVAFDRSPAERTAGHRAELRQRLMSAPYGWSLTYFPNVDSLLFRNATKRWEDTEVQQDRFGYGGYAFTLKFSSEQEVELKADIDQYGTEQSFVGGYDVRLGSQLQLSFTTYTPLHSLVDNEWQGVADLLYRYTDFAGRLIFTTSHQGLSNRPYIVLSPLSKPDEWSASVAKAREHRHLFERMAHPQLTIRQGSRLFFRSDVPFRDSRGDRRKELERNRRRYHLFVARRQRHELLFRGGYNALGSGYVGTEHGISFHPGFAVDSKRLFCDFERVGDSFVCELVRVYDTQLQRFVLLSRHLYPEGERTGYIAEIQDTKEP